MHHFRRIVARNLPSLALAGACIALAPACGSDARSEPDQPEAGTGSGGRSETGGTGGLSAGGTGGTAMPGTGGTAGAAAGAGGKAAGGSAGTGGHATGGTAGGGNRDAGAPDASVEPDGSTPDAAPEPSTDGALGPAEVLCSGDAGAAHGTLFVSGTDYATSSELAAVDLVHRCVRGRTVFDDSDIVARVSNGHPFVLERTKDRVAVIDAGGQVKDTVRLNEVDGSTASMNPHDIVYAKPASGGAKAYVSLYNAGKIAVLNPETADLEKKIDVSFFRDATDADGSPDPDVGFYDATTERVYFVLQRTDLTTAFSKPFIVHCPPVPSLLVGIDVATDTLIDLNGAAAGVGLPLSLVAPADVALDGRRALLLANGCGSKLAVDGGGYERVLAGVESVNLDTLATSVLFTPSSQNFFNHMVLLASDSALLQSFDNTFATLWNKWATSSPSLGDAITGVPAFAVAEGPDSLLGTFITGKHARVARYSVSTQVAATVVSSPWAGTYSSTSSVALMK